MRPPIQSLEIVKETEYGYNQSFAVAVQTTVAFSTLYNRAMKLDTHYEWDGEPERLDGSAWVNFMPRDHDLCISLDATGKIEITGAWCWEDGDDDALDGMAEPPKELTLSQRLEIAQLVRTLIN